jgi:hypothetical protein
MAQPIDGGIDAVVELNQPALGPESMAQFFAGHELTGPLQERRQNRKRLPGELAGASVTQKFARLEVGLKPAEGNRGRMIWILHNSVPQTHLCGILDPNHPRCNAGNNVEYPVALVTASRLHPTSGGFPVQRRCDKKLTFLRCAVHCAGDGNRWKVAPIGPAFESGRETKKMHMRPVRR